MSSCCKGCPFANYKMSFSREHKYYQLAPATCTQKNSDHRYCLLCLQDLPMSITEFHNNCLICERERTVRVLCEVEQTQLGGRDVCKPIMPVKAQVSHSGNVRSKK